MNPTSIPIIMGINGMTRHLLLHLDAYNVEESVEDKDQENEANVFASHFLMPEKAFVSEWNDTYGLSFVDRVLKVKRIFQVSRELTLQKGFLNSLPEKLIFNTPVAGEKSGQPVFFSVSHSDPYAGNTPV